MKKTVLILIACLLIVSCNHNEKYRGFSNKAEYEKALENIDYFQYRFYSLWNGIEERNFKGLEEIIKQDRLIGNQIDYDYMMSIKSIIYLKNGKSFDNKELDEQYVKMYKWYKPKKIDITDPKEVNILQQIESYLDPVFIPLDISCLKDNINGIWQIDDWGVHDGYLQTLRFNNNNFEIRKNEMAKSERFLRITGTFELDNNNIVLHPLKMERIEGGEYFDGDNDGLIQEYIGGNKNEISIPNNSCLTYIVISVSQFKTDSKILRIELITDKPHYYFKIKDKIE